jgi:benzoyl-CoA reductase/2-hydroxyglutaryl-CoA dehydratase subunit BcrC/BadD/HgdB
VSLEDILRKGFSKGICNLILGSYWEDLDKLVPYVFAKVMVTYVDVLGTRAKLWKPCEFQRTRVVFKNFAVYVGLGTDHLKTLLANFLNQKHDRKYVS